MDDTTILGATLGQLGQTVKKVGQQIVKLPEEMGKDLAGQVGVGGTKEPAASAASNAASGEPRWQSDEERIKFLRDLYGNKDMSKDGAPDPKSANPNPPANKSLEEQKELAQLRQQLHKQVYYDPTFNPQKKQEERPAEKVEKEKKMEALELEEKEKKKPPPLAVVRERNKAEMFRGAAG